MKSFFPTRLAEILYAFIIGFFGILHFINADILSGVIPDYFPGNGIVWIYITGIGFILAALAILLNKLKTMACYLLAVMWLIFIFTLHLQPALAGNPGELLKNAGLAMTAIIIGNRTSK